MTNSSQDADAILRKVTSGMLRVPGVVAMATDRNGTIFEGAAGKRSLDQPQDMTLDSVFAIFSTTKAITGTTVLQCVEEGKIDLDAPAKTYLPEIGSLEVLDGFDADGKPKLRAPKRDITTRMLLLHTAGCAYDFFNEDYATLIEKCGYEGVVGATKGAFRTPLIFDPGDRWEYGHNIDWAGRIVEAVRGKRLGAVMKERVFDPLGMTSAAFQLSPDMRTRLTTIHARQPDGSLAPMTGFELPPEPAIHMGGHGLYGTVPDYMKFIRMWLNDGEGPHGRVLKKETVLMAEKNCLGDKKIKMLPGVNPALSNDAEFFPGMPKSWALTFMVNDLDAPTGRSAGSLAWAGLANCYYWIDRKNGVGGYWATQIFPFADPTSVGGYLDFETSIYAALGKKKAA